VVYEAVGENVKVTIDGVGSDGKPTHNEWTGKYDGKDYPVVGDPNSDAQSLTKIDDHTLGFNVKKSGKTTISSRVVVSADGKSRTVTSSGTDSKGNGSVVRRCTTNSSKNYGNDALPLEAGRKGIWRLGTCEFLLLTLVAAARPLLSQNLRATHGQAKVYTSPVGGRVVGGPPARGCFRNHSSQAVCQSPSPRGSSFSADSFPINRE